MKQKTATQIALEVGLVSEGEVWFSPNAENMDVSHCDLEEVVRLARADERKKYIAIDKELAEVYEMCVTQARTIKAMIDEKEAADFWRGKYDELIRHIESQNQYRKYLETQVFGGPTH